MNILERIKQIEEEKRNSKKFPTHAMYISLASECVIEGIPKNELSSKLDQLENDGKIERGDTVNDQYIKSI